MAIPGDTSTPTGQTIIARLERLEVWSLSYTFIAIIGLGFLFTFYDIFDINVSFIQTCIALDPQCTPETELGQLPFPVVLNLLGYVVGTLVLSPIADKIGRRNMLLITMLITGLGPSTTPLPGISLISISPGSSPVSALAQIWPS